MSIETFWAKAIIEEMIKMNIKDKGIDGVSLCRVDKGTKHQIQADGEDIELVLLLRHYEEALDLFSAEGYNVNKKIDEDGYHLFEVKREINTD